MKTEDFSFQLPQELIAQDPADPRDACRLLVMDKATGGLKHLHFYDLPSLLRPGDVLVLNNSRVLPARMLFEVEGKECELFLLRADGESDWFAIGKPGKILLPEKIFTIAENFTFEVRQVLADGQRKVRFHCTPQELNSLIEKYGHTPLPPYIKHSHSKPEDYQTVYAKNNGSVAAPTAGLHFTPQLLEQLQKKGVETAFVTLHVGLGTFLPIKTSEVEKHTMHSEIFELSASTAKILENARQEGRRIIAVGSTSVRVLESCFDTTSGFTAQVGETAIYIYPGYQWKCVNGFITNFHLPQSTLLLLTCAFGGTEQVLKAYQEAVSERYRFYSFGDVMLII